MCQFLLIIMRRKRRSYYEEEEEESEVDQKQKIEAERETTSSHYQFVELHFRSI